MGITQIIKRNGDVINLNTKEPYCALKEATLNSSLMGDDYISLKIISSQWLSFDKGDRLVYDGMDYTIRATTTREVVSDGYYSYEPMFYGPMYDLMKTIYRNTDIYGKSDKSTFDLTYTIKEFVQVLINNLNRDYKGWWAFDEDNCPDTEPRTLQFSAVNCLQALQTLCNKDNFNLEFLITQEGGVRTIHIGKFGKRIAPPQGAEYFEWGKGNGLYGLKEQKIDDKAIITRLWAEGGTNNIRVDYRDYSERLQLPLGTNADGTPRRNEYEHILEDGTVIDPHSEEIGIADDAHRYFEDTALRDKLGSEEDCKVYDDIYPTRTGKVTATVDGELCMFVDDTMDFDLNEKEEDKGTKYLVEGTNAKITFISGKLAGQQFDITKYEHDKKRFRIIAFTDNRGLTIPSAEAGSGYQIEVGDAYKITDIFLPEQYERQAEENLWYAALQDFNAAKQAKAQYSLTLDRLYFLDAIGGGADVCYFKVGDYVPVKDDRFGIKKEIRIQKIKRNLLVEQDYELTLSDSTAINVAAQTVLTVIDHENIINNNSLRDLNKARRGWRTTEDLRNMVYDTDGYFDVDNIRPNSIDTNMLTVGSKSQQFVLSNVIFQANQGGNPNRLTASGGLLSHLTIDPNGIRVWNMVALENVTLTNNGGWYLFARCAKSGNYGNWYLSQTPLKFEIDSDPNNYYFQVGIIGPLHSDLGFRDFTTTYGFTRINGNTITTGRIVTSDGECYLDLDGNKFRMGNSASSIDWNVTRSNAITLRNVALISESGDVSPLGVYRGVWNANYIYYPNDEVSYTDANGSTATYRYINPEASKGHIPTESTYWAIVAKGADGKAGDWVSYAFVKSDTQPPTPTDTKPIPTNWKDAPDSVGKWWMSKATISGTTGKAGAWSVPIQTTGEDGVAGPYTDFKYAKNKSDVNAPSLDSKLRNPSGWSDEPPTLGVGDYLWMIQAEINASNELVNSWSAPVRISGEKGADGKAGVGVKIVYRYSIEKPNKPTGTSQNPAEWADTPDRETIVVNHIGNFTTENGWYKSPTIEDDGIVKNRISFTTTKPNQVLAIELWVDSEEDYDFLLLGNLDIIKLEREAFYSERISGPDERKIVYLQIPAVGPHFVDVAYAKDESEREGEDCGRYRIVDVNNCWVSIGNIDENGNITSWSDPMPFSIDGADMERIYFLRGVKVAPPTPSTDEYKDDYVPRLTSPDYTNGKTYNMGDMVVGANGKVYESIANGNTSAPCTAVVDVSGRSGWIYGTGWQVCNGWTDNPSGVTTARRYEYESVRKKKDGKWGAFSMPVLWMVLPQDGQDGGKGDKGDKGDSGDFTEYRYAVSGSKTSHGQTFNAASRIPDNKTESGTVWKTAMPAVGALQYLWLTTAKVSGATDALLSNWTEPIRVTPYDGVDGSVGPAPMYQGEYKASKVYVGTPYRVDCVKYNGTYWVAAVDATQRLMELGKSFSNFAPSASSPYWNDFGGQFESVATQLLLAEFANIANLVFKNERLESQSQTGGVPNFFIDGLRSIASFGAGSVVFDNASAIIGWLSVIGRDLIGTDADGVQRLRLTPNSLPTVNLATTTQDLVVKNYGSSDDTVWDGGMSQFEVAFKNENAHYYRERDDYYEDAKIYLNGWVDFDIEEDSTTLDLSELQHSCVAHTYNDRSVQVGTYGTATVSLKNGNNWERIANVALDNSGSCYITIPKAGRIRVELYVHADIAHDEDWWGTISIAAQSIRAKTAKTETIIAKDGMMSIFNANYMRMHSTDGFEVKIGNYGFRINSSGFYRNTGGTAWTKINLT